MSDKEGGFDISVGLLENSRIGIRMALKVINLIVSGIGGNLGVSQALLVSRNRKVELDLSKSKQMSMSELGFSLLSLIIMTLEFLVLVVIHNLESKRSSIKETSSNWMTNRCQCTL